MKNKKNTKIIFLIVTFLIILIMLSIFKTQNNNSIFVKEIFDFELDKNAEKGEIEKLTIEEVQENLNKKVEDGMLNISINTNPSFLNAKVKGNLQIVNSKENKYIQVIEIIRDDTNELIYKSGGLKPGEKIVNDSLDKQLEKGEYKCTAYFNAINEDTKELIGKAGAKILVTILN